MTEVLKSKPADVNDERAVVEIAAPANDIAGSI